MDQLWQDLQYGLRMMRKSPGFIVAAILTLALGIGINSAMFNIVNTILFRPLGVIEPNSLIHIYQTPPYGGSQYDSFSFRAYEFIRSHNGVFSDVLAFGDFSTAFTSDDTSEVIIGNLVSGNYFDVLGLKPVRGRTIGPEEEQQAEGDPVIMISDGLWNRRFQRDPGVIGRSIRLNGRSCTVIGVVPSRFRGLLNASIMPAEAWIPLSMAEQVGLKHRPEAPWLQLTARLKPGASIEAAQASMPAVMRELEQALPKIYRLSSPEDRAFQISLFRADKIISRPSGDRILHLLAICFSTVALLVLLIAAANLANLFLANTEERGREITTRLALGAGRGRIILQLLTENLLLSVFAGGVAFLLGHWLARIMVIYFGNMLPFALRFAIDVKVEWRGLLLTISVCLATSMICGLGPAISMSKVNVIRGSKVSNPALFGHSRYAMRHWLIVPQVALSLFLLLVAGLFIRSLQTAQSQDLGYDPSHIAFITLDVSLHAYDEPRGRELYRVLVERARQLPGVTSACVADWPPPDIDYETVGLELTDRESSFARLAQLVRAGTGFQEMLSIPIMQGRNFSRWDLQSGIPVLMIDQKGADEMWPGQDAVGKTVIMHLGEMITFGEGPRAEIIGVTKDIRGGPIDYSNNRSCAFIPFESYYSPRMNLIAKTQGSATSLIGQLGGLVKQIDPRLTVLQARTMSDFAGSLFWTTKTAAVISTVLGLLGLFLGSLGIYALVSHAVARCTQEIGIRVAIGADRRSLLLPVMSQTIKMVVLGSVLGLSLAVATTRILSSYLYGITPTDSMTFIMVPLLFGFIALLGCYIPARRAARFDPMVALRSE